jgi:hypothetical protein
MRYVHNFRTYYFTERSIRNDGMKMDRAKVGYESFTKVAHDNK